MVMKQKEINLKYLTCVDRCNRNMSW